jgi:beta-glucosidase-like glycosyl hydrolase
MLPIYKNPTAPIQDRVADLMQRMTIEEKIAQLHAFWLILSPDGKHEVRTDKFTGAADADQLQAMLKHGLGQITRPLGSRPVEPREGVRALNTLQKFMCEETRLGIPVMSHEECLSGLMARGGTLFPSSLAFGATWNPDLIEEVGRAIGMEARSVGCHQGLAPVLDVARDARWGRTEETFGEDPYLTGVMASRYVAGLQGEKRDLLATLKHFAGHSASEGGRNHAPAALGWRDLNDTFLLPFEMAVKLANAGSVMPAYNDIDGEPCHSSRRLLTEILRDQWGFDGLIVADYIGINLLHQHHGVTADAAESAAQAFNAGLDLELPGNDCAQHLQTALERGQISVETLDAAVSRVLTEKFRIGLFEKPYTDEHAIHLQSPDTLALARKVAQESVVILENNGILPISGRPKIAILGPTADDPLALLGDYSFPVHLIVKDEVESTQDVITPKTAFEAHFGRQNVVYAKGCHILEQREFGNPVFPGDVLDNTQLDVDSKLSRRLDLIGEAVEATKSADLAVVCLGDLSGVFQTGTVGEGSDVDSLELPGVQQQLLEAVVETGTPVILVLSSGRPYTLGGLEPKLAALVMSFFGGQEGGNGLVDVLTGAVEPSGRLTLSIPRSAGASPYYYNHKFKSSGTPIARHFGSRYPFGHGLSYTDFTFEDLVLESAKVPSESGVVTLEFTVLNTGTRAGFAVPQLYIRDRVASVVRPVKELKGFGKIFLRAGESRRVKFDIPSDMFFLTDLRGHRVVEPGHFDVAIGTSSNDIRLTAVVEMIGNRYELPRKWRMTSDFSAVY